MGYDDRGEIDGALTERRVFGNTDKFCCSNGNGGDSNLFEIELVNYQP
jgi:hypothetical protein